MKRRSRRIVQLALPLALATALSLWVAASSSARVKAPAKTILIGESNPHLSNPVLQTLNVGVQAAAKKLGWKVKVLDNQLNPDKQITDLDTLTSLHVAAILSWTLNPGAADAAYQRASSAGIPIVGWNSTSKFIDTDVKTLLSSNCAPFQQEAAYIAKRIPGAKLLVIGGPPVPALTLRLTCFLQAAKKAGLKVQEQQANMSDALAPAQQIAQDMLTKYPGTQAIWAYDDQTALGASAALASSGKQVWSGKRKGVIVVGNNADPEGVAGVKSGNLTVTYDENLFQAGVAAVRVLAPVLSGGKSASTMPKQVLVTGKMYDSSNIGTFVPAQKRAVKLK